MIGNKIPTTDLSRTVDEEVLDEIEARMNAGWRVRTDMELMIQYIRAKLLEARQSKLKEKDAIRCGSNRGVCQGLPGSSNGCSKGNTQVS